MKRLAVLILLIFSVAVNADMAKPVLTEETVEDYVGGMLTGTETAIDVNYDDANGVIDFVISEGDINHDNLAGYEPNEHTDWHDAGDNEEINLGAGGLSGNLGSDLKVYSDGTDGFIQRESPSGTFQNPYVKLKFFELSSGVYVLVWQFGSTLAGSPFDNGIAVMDHSLYVQDVEGVADGKIFIPDKAYPTDNRNGTLSYNSSENKFYIKTEGTDGGGNIRMDPAGGTIESPKLIDANDVTITGKFEPKRVSQNDEPTADANEMLIWHDADANAVYLIFNDPDEGQGKIQFTIP